MYSSMQCNVTQHCCCCKTYTNSSREVQHTTIHSRANVPSSSNIPSVIIKSPISHQHIHQSLKEGNWFWGCGLNFLSIIFTLHFSSSLALTNTTERNVCVQLQRDYSVVHLYRKKYLLDTSSSFGAVQFIFFRFDFIYYIPFYSILFNTIHSLLQPEFPNLCAQSIQKQPSVYCVAFCSVPSRSELFRVVPYRM